MWFFSPKNPYPALKNREKKPVPELCEHTLQLLNLSYFNLFSSVLINHLRHINLSSRISRYFTVSNNYLRYQNLQPWLTRIVCRIAL